MINVLADGKLIALILLLRDSLLLYHLFQIDMFTGYWYNARRALDSSRNQHVIYYMDHYMSPLCSPCAEDLALLYEHCGSKHCSSMWA